jgi:hypothetical protein
MLKTLVLASLLTGALSSFSQVISAERNSTRTAVSFSDYTCYMNKGNLVIVTGSVCESDTQKATKNAKQNAFLVNVQ